MKKSAIERLGHVVDKHPDLGGFVSDRTKVYTKVGKALGSFKTAVNKMTQARNAVKVLTRLGGSEAVVSTKGIGVIDLDRAKVAAVAGAEVNVEVWSRPRPRTRLFARLETSLN